MTHSASSTPPAARSSLSRFVLASLLVHVLVLSLGHHAEPSPRQSLGQPTLQAELAPAPARPIHRTGTRTALTAPADRVLPIRQSDSAPVAPVHHEVVASRQSDQAAMQNYLLGLLQTALARYLRYPALARERGWQGTVLVGVAVASNGVLTSARLLRSSGYPILDDASLSSLRRIHHLPLETGTPGQEPVEVILPIRFQLADNR